MNNREEYTFKMSDLTTVKELLASNKICHSNMVMHQTFLSNCKNVSFKYFNGQLKSTESQKILKSMFDYFENLCDFIFERLETAESNYVVADLTELLEVLVSFIDCVKSILEVIVRLSNILFCEVESVIFTTQQLLKKCYQHCNVSERIYGENFDCVRDLLRKVFQEIYQTHVFLFKLLHRLDCKAYYKENDRLKLSEVCKGFLPLSFIISELDKKLLMMMWKHLLCFVVKFEVVLKDVMQFEDYIKIIGEHILSNLKICVEIYQANPQQDLSDDYDMKTSRSLTECFSNSLCLFVYSFRFRLTLEDARIFISLCVETIATLLSVIKVADKDHRSMSVSVWVQFIGTILSDQSKSLSSLLSNDDVWKMLLDFDEYSSKDVKYITWLVIANSFVDVQDNKKSWKLIESLTVTFIEAYPHLSDYFCLPIFPLKNSSAEDLTRSFYDVTIEFLCTTLMNTSVERLWKFMHDSNDSGLRGMILEGVISEIVISLNGNMTSKFVAGFIHALDTESDIITSWQFHKRTCLMLENIKIKSTQLDISFANENSLAHCYKVCFESTDVAMVRTLSGSLSNATKNISQLLNNLDQARISSLHNLTCELLKIRIYLKFIKTNENSEWKDVFKQCTQPLQEFLSTFSKFWTIFITKINSDVSSSIIVNQFIQMSLELFLVVPASIYNANQVQQIIGSCAELQASDYSTQVTSLLAHFSKVKLNRQTEQNVVKMYKEYLSHDYSSCVRHSAALQSFDEFSKTTSSSHILKDCVSNPIVKQQVEKYMKKIPPEKLSKYAEIEVLKVLSNVNVVTNLAQYVDDLQQSHRTKTSSVPVAATTTTTSSMQHPIVKNFIHATDELTNFLKQCNNPSLHSEILTFVKNRF